MPPKKSPGSASKKKGSLSKRAHRKVLRDNIQGITRPAITRVLRKAGALRVSGLVYEELRGVIKMMLESLMSRVVALVDYDRHRTIKELYVQEALKTMGLHSAIGLEITTHITKHEIHKSGGSAARRSKPGRVALREIRFYQKHSDTLVFPREAMKRFIREVTQDFKADVKFTKKALLLIQAIVETYVVDLGRAAVMCAVHDGGRKSLQPSDIQLARAIARMQVFSSLSQAM